jgi:hypothetical protein
MQRLTATADLKGLWRRSLIVRPDGTRDTTSRVHWLQGAGAFIDLRQPQCLPHLAHLSALNDLSTSDCGGPAYSIMPSRSATRTQMGPLANASGISSSARETSAH